MCERCRLCISELTDREGEAISWHLAQVLGIDTTEMNRVVFNEVTKDAVIDALKNPRTNRS